MRQKDREVKDLNEIIEIMRNCDVCRLALHDEEFPYILPLNFGMEVVEGRIKLYFHSALEGYKVELIKKDNRASFEMDRNHQLQYFEEQGYCTMSYESVIGQGIIRVLNENERAAALEKLMAHYHKGKRVWYNPAAIPRTMVYVLDVQRITAKRKLPK